ncbi:hypothetical protein [Hymenobacter sp. 102]|uniref:hypothetical protein n=1 Tax=Hymenobacter sp. 102 TaxID=3403152 RepID=UPI003CF7760B
MDALTAPTLRELMPAGFIKELARRTGCKSASRLSGLVSMEGPCTAREWPAIEALARETDPTGFDRWKEALHAHAA